MSKSEQAVMNDILLELARHGVLLFRNNTGALKDEHGRLVRFGLAVGSSDLIGMTPITITQDMVGEKLAVFTAIEAKASRGKATSRQQAFIRRVIELGGLAGVARSVEDALKIIKGTN